MAIARSRPEAPPSARSSGTRPVTKDEPIELDVGAPVSTRGPVVGRTRTLPSLFDDDDDTLEIAETPPPSVRRVAAATPAASPFTRERALRAVAGFGDPPPGLLAAPLYALDVARKRRALEREISTAPAWDRDVLLEALSSYDRAAFRRGLLVGVAGATLGVVVTIAAIAKMTGAPVAVEGPTLEWSTAEAKPPQP